MNESAELVRFCYGGNHTLGWLRVGPLLLATIERPWIATAAHGGGLNRRSCIPDGEYGLHRHHSARFPRTFALEAPELDVYRWDEPGRPGRYAILIHQGNVVEDVIGCIAVGLSHTQIEGKTAVGSSAVALARLRAELGERPLPRLIVRATRGTREEGSE